MRDKDNPLWPMTHAEQTKRLVEDFARIYTCSPDDPDIVDATHELSEQGKVWINRDRYGYTVG